MDMAVGDDFAGVCDH